MEGPTMGVTAAATFCATLVDEFVRGGVTDAVLAPGSRSTPMALALDGDDRVRLHVHLDERSAAFTALGLGLATGRPALVLTTSGTAAVELHPAVVEASYNRVPLIVLTADRPPELQEVGAPQTIDQHELYGSAVRAFIAAEVADEAHSAGWREIAGRALHAARGRPPGPVQVNLPFRDPLIGVAGELPSADPDTDRSDAGAPVSPTSDDLARLGRVCGERRGLIVAGGHVDDPRAVLDLAAHLGWPVFADPRSGCRVPDPVVVAHFDALLRSDARQGAAPDAVLRFGSLPASKVLSEWLRDLDAEQIGVDADGVLSDPHRDLGPLVVASSGEVARALIGSVAAGRDSSWLERWVGADRRAASSIDEALAGRGRLTDPHVARRVVADLADGADLVVSSSMPVRDVEWYAEARRGVRVLANRGANGIDGVVSTAVGVALAGAPTVALVGDVAFLHDTNGLLGLAPRDVDLTIVVVDNDGGAIFSFLPQAQVLDQVRYERLFGTPHGLDLVAVARAHGVEASEVRSTEELTAAVRRDRAGSRVVVVRTDRAANVAVHDAIHRAVGEAQGG